MGIFDYTYHAEHANNMRAFLGYPKAGFNKNYGFANPDTEKPGKLPTYASERLEALELEVNKKAARCEVPDTTIGERYELAVAYARKKSFHVMRAVGVSRHIIQRMKEGVVPKAIDKIAESLNVPVQWLVQGGVEHLPANTALGLRTGEEAKKIKQALLVATDSIIAGLPRDADQQYLYAYVEWMIFHQRDLANLARQCGGRWHFNKELGMLVFVPWVYVPLKQPKAKFPPRVEEIIKEEMLRWGEVNKAHPSIKARCEAEGLAYPAAVTLFRRIAAQKKLIEERGIDLNTAVKTAYDKYMASVRG